jgi:hypothetical protein
MASFVRRYAYLVWKTKQAQHVPPDSGGDEPALVKLGQDIMGQEKYAFRRMHCRVVSCRVVSGFVLCRVVSGFVVSLFCLVLSCLVLSCPVVSCFSFVVLGLNSPFTSKPQVLRRRARFA